MKTQILAAVLMIGLTAPAQTLREARSSRLFVSSTDALVEHGFSQLEWSRDGRRLFCGWHGISYSDGLPGALDVWDVATKRRLHRLRPQGGGELVNFGVSRDGKRVAANFSGGGWRVRSPADEPWPHVLGRVCVWDVASGRLLNEWQTPQTRLYGFAFSPDGMGVAAGGGDNTVRLWHVGKPAEIWKKRGQSYGWVQGLAFSGDGARLYCLRNTKAKDKLTILAPATGRLTRLLKSLGPTETGSHLALSPRETACYVGGGRTTKGRGDFLIALPSGRQMWTENVATHRASFSPDGRLLALSYSEESAGDVLDVRTGRVIFDVESPLDADGNSAALAIAFKPNSKTIAVAAQSGSANVFTIRFYDLPRP